LRSAGALAIAIARLLKQRRRDSQTVQVIAVDLSPKAVEYTSRNAQRLGVSDVLEVRRGSWCEPCGDLLGCLGGIVSNPPYIPQENMNLLQAEVGRCEYCCALAVVDVDCTPTQKCEK
jgi:release factor glutamine methyltransferase